MHSKDVFHDKAELIAAVVRKDDTVLDVGFWGQGLQVGNEQWPHAQIVKRAARVDGVDLDLDTVKLHKLNPGGMYLQESAEDFRLDKKYSLIFAGDLIEHLPNPGKFLDCCKEHLTRDGRLVITTPNAFNLFVLAGKLMHSEPPVNRDHVSYFNRTTLTKLFEKCGWTVQRVGFLYTLGDLHKESLKKKVLNVIYAALLFLTPKYLETMVVVVSVRNHVSE